jgi:hypothetical protein
MQTKANRKDVKVAAGLKVRTHVKAGGVATSPAVGGGGGGYN